MNTEPKFKIGDRLIHRAGKNIGYFIVQDVDIYNQYYKMANNKYASLWSNGSYPFEDIEINFVDCDSIEGVWLRL